MLSPERRGVLIWNVAMLVVIGYYLVETGMLVGWGQAFWSDELQYLSWLNIIFAVLLLGDILLGPLKAFYSKGILI